MPEESSKRLNRDAWLKAALNIVRKSGIDAVKISSLAAEMGVTTGSFYWHFESRGELLNAVLKFWEREMTDGIVDATRGAAGAPEDRILSLMEAVMAEGLARYDLAISHWAQSDVDADKVFRRVLKKRFDFATWMFSEAGFSPEEAEARGRLMVVYMMGELSLVSDSKSRRLEMIRQKHAILMAPPVGEAG